MVSIFRGKRLALACSGMVIALAATVVALRFFLGFRVQVGMDRGEVVGAAGEPNRVTFKNDEEIWTYHIDYDCHCVAIDVDSGRVTRIYGGSR